MVILMAYIELKNIKKNYQMGELTIPALAGVSFTVEKGELVVVLGPSGAGKTTVLNILGGMDNADSGSLIIDGKNISNYNKNQLVNYRKKDIGFVFQFYNLVQNLTALENVELASQIVDDAMDSNDALNKVGLSNRINNFPSQLSGGEQQRVAIARALAKKPKLLLCDEPTGALDSKTGKRILDLLQTTSHNFKMTTIIITHNSVIADIADRVIKMKNGLIESIEINENPKLVKDLNW
jgi:putative ABC transport system ATP-binding protein